MRDRPKKKSNVNTAKEIVEMVKEACGICGSRLTIGLNEPLTSPPDERGGS